MGAAAAAASLAGLDEKGIRYALSYDAQQVSGLWSWVRDPEHVEKAFDFSGMGARNGVTAAIMAQMGFTGVWDVLDGEHNVLAAFSTEPKPEAMLAGAIATTDCARLKAPGVTVIVGKTDVTALPPMVALMVRAVPDVLPVNVAV